MAEYIKLYTYTTARKAIKIVIQIQVAEPVYPAALNESINNPAKASGCIRLMVGLILR